MAGDAPTLVELNVMARVGHSDEKDAVDEVRRLSFEMKDSLVGKIPLIWPSGGPRLW